MRPSTSVEESELPDRTPYERLIGDGIAAAGARGSAVDHVTARAAGHLPGRRPQSPVFAQSLLRFVRIGEVSRALKTQLRIHAASAPTLTRHRPPRPMEYCVACGTDLGPDGENFGACHDQIDRADRMLAGAHARVRHSRPAPQQAWAETAGPRMWTALARHDPETQTVTLVLDTTATVCGFQNGA